MSAQPTSARTRVSKLFLLAVIAIVPLLAPQLASADGILPAGVLEQQKCGTFTVDIRASGAGMMYNTSPIGTSSARVSYISATEGCAVVQWETTTPVATQVLFAELGQEPITITTAIDPDFGYPNGTPQNNAGVASHTAILEGLEVGKAYSYRLVNRSHPTALPSISDPLVLIVNTNASFTAPIVIPAPVAPIIPTTPVIVPTVSFDAEKFPLITPSTPPDTTPVVEKPVVEDSPTEDDASGVPAAVNAVDEALRDSSQEMALWSRIKGFFSSLLPDKDRLSLTSSIGLFEKDRYIIPTLFFLLLLFLLQQLVLPAFNVSLKEPILYWLFGTVVLVVLSAVFMFYYITLIGIALFLGLLAWYLLKSIPDEGSGGAPVQPKLLESKDSKQKSAAKEKTGK